MGGRASRRAPPVRPPEDRDPGGPRDRRADRRRPVRVRRGRHPRAASIATRRRGRRRPASPSSWPRWRSTCGWRATNAARRTSWAARSCDADARHTQSDLYASGAVVASFVAARAGIGWADGVATLLLVRLIGHAAWEVFRENVPVLIDAAMLDPASVVALAGPLARGGSVHRVRSRGVRGAVELDLHLEVAPDMSVVGSSRARSSRSSDGVESKVPGGFRRNHPHRTETQNQMHVDHHDDGAPAS